MIKLIETIFNHIFRTNKNNIFNPYEFALDTKKKLKIESNVEFKFDEKSEDSENQAIGFTIYCGVKGYRFDALTEHQKTKICNTLYHELVHIRDKEDLIKKGIMDKINGKRSLENFGYRLFDEYVSYYEANQYYPESEADLNSSSEDVYNVIYNRLAVGYITFKGKEPWREEDKRALYNSCYDNCCALIARYVICGFIGDDVEKYLRMNQAVKILESYYERRLQLTLNDYAIIAKKFINTLIQDLRTQQQEILKKNTGIW